MTTLTVTIDDSDNVKDIIKYLKSFDCVKTVSISKKTPKKTQNFAIAGNPASDKELEVLISAMEQDSDKGINTLQLKSKVQIF